MRFLGDGYRAHHPRWSFSPLSGEGAALHGGRFNPKGVPAFYLSLTLEGAIVEASQGFKRKIEPLTICSYEIDCDDVAHLRDIETCHGLSVEQADLAFPWLLDVSEGRTPRSWKLASRLLAAGLAGVIVPSFANAAKADMANLVLWRWGGDRPYRVEVNDPSGRLPRNMLSWLDE